MEDRARRVGENEALFRRVNEQIESVNEAFGSITRDFTIVCECGDASCVSQFAVTPGDYERIRADSTRFLVLPGHVIEDVEDVVERNGVFWVVEKHEGEPARLAEALDDGR